MIKGFESLEYGLIQLGKRKELPIAKSPENVVRNDADGSFFHGFAFGRSYAARKSRCAVMLRHFVVRFVEGDFVSAVRHDTGFQIVALQDTGYAAGIPESIDMRGDPALLIHEEERFHVGVPAVRQRQDEYVRRNRFTDIHIYDRRGISSPVHPHDLAGLVVFCIIA